MVALGGAFGALLVRGPMSFETRGGGAERKLFPKLEARPVMTESMFSKIKIDHQSLCRASRAEAFNLLCVARRCKPKEMLERVAVPIIFHALLKVRCPFSMVWQISQCATHLLICDEINR